MCRVSTPNDLMRHALGVQEQGDGRWSKPYRNHFVAGGRWRCLVPGDLRQSNDGLHDVAARFQRVTLEALEEPAVWWSIDSTGRPCAWPVVAEAPRG